MPVGSGQRPLRGDPALPLLELASFLPFNNPEGQGGGPLPSVLEIPDAAPHPPPTAPSPQPREAGGGGRRASVQRWGSRLRSLGTGAPAPRLPRLRPLVRLRARAARHASCAGSSPGLGVPRSAGRAGFREWARAASPAGAQGYGRRRAGRHRRRPAAERAAPGVPGVCCFEGLPAPKLLSPIPKLSARSRAAGRNGVARPSPARKETSARSQDGPRGPPPGSQPAAPRGPRKVRPPLGPAGAGARSPGGPAAAARPTATRTGALLPSPEPGRASWQAGGASLSRGLPRWRGERCT